MSNVKVPFYFSCLVLVTALLRWPTYTFPFGTLEDERFWSVELVVGNLMCISFLLFPILAFLGFILKWRSSYFWLGLSPLVFFMFGTIPIPFAGYLYSDISCSKYHSNCSNRHSCSVFCYLALSLYEGAF